MTRRHFSSWNKRRKEEEKRIRFSFQQRTAVPSRPVPVICEADKAKARIKKLIAEEATGEMRSAGSTCTVASGLSCSTISGKKAGMSAPAKLALRPCHFFAANSNSSRSLHRHRMVLASLSEKLRWLAMVSRPCKIASWCWCHPVDWIGLGVFTVPLCTVLYCLVQARETRLDWATKPDKKTTLSDSCQSCFCP